MAKAATYLKDIHFRIPYEQGQQLQIKFHK